MINNKKKMKEIKDQLGIYYIKILVDLNILV